MTGHLIDKNWKMKNALLFFERILPPHTGQSSAYILLEVVEYLGLFKSILEVTIDNGSEIVKGLEQISAELRMTYYNWIFPPN